MFRSTNKQHLLCASQDYSIWLAYYFPSQITVIICPSMSASLVPHYSPWFYLSVEKAISPHVSKDLATVYLKITLSLPYVRSEKSLGLLFPRFQIPEMTSTGLYLGHMALLVLLTKVRGLQYSENPGLDSLPPSMGTSSIRIIWWRQQDNSCPEKMHR